VPALLLLLLFPVADVDMLHIIPGISKLLLLLLLLQGCEVG
jgi:hypothetical protein